MYGIYTQKHSEFVFSNIDCHFNKMKPRRLEGPTIKVSTYQYFVCFNVGTVFEFINSKE